MQLKTLELSGFRNYEKLHMEFGKGFNIIYGDNAQGKTNIIESVFLCAAGRSHRTSKDSDMVMNGRDGFKVGLGFERKDGDSEIEITYIKEEKKKIKVNDLPLKKIGQLMGCLNVVIFSPENLLIIKEGPAERRRYIDITLSQLMPSYFFDLQRYCRILLQRNAALRDISIGGKSGEILDVWTQHLVKTGSSVMKRRKEFIEKISERAAERHLKLTNGAEILKIEYRPSFDISDLERLEEIEEKFSAAIQSFRKKELAKCVTLLGPHRDDFEIVINGLGSKHFGSQGQQRTSILSIKLSEIDIMYEETGEYPVLLLDDVLSELDAGRQKQLFENISNIQALITCTDKRYFEGTGENARFFNVVAGKIYER